MASLRSHAVDYNHVKSWGVLRLLEEPAKDQVCGAGGNRFTPPDTVISR
jgi:hypothetical protein